MGPLLYIMAIMGCGESEAACEQVAVVEQQYRSEEECLAATEDELLRRDDILFPAVVAQCRRADAGPQLVRGDEVMLPAAPAPQQRLPRFADAGPQPRLSR
ncbi:MAG TPA: hypothetical protein VGX37_10980 [Allosphingosinicella sp.]|jgi:hypothetical protein|nr:hypothetical protein [Allosphingosinicella sp.]